MNGILFGFYSFMEVVRHDDLLVAGPETVHIGIWVPSDSEPCNGKVERDRADERVAPTPTPRPLHWTDPYAKYTRTRHSTS